MTPLSPADCDLRSFDWFPLHHKRLRSSAFWKRASDTACRISVEFWSEAYEQVPAGSLPDDDVQLSDWAGFGRRNLTEWLAVKEEVMSAWTLCDDGRWYHPTLCEVANEAWDKRKAELERREADRKRKEDRKKGGGKPPISGGNSDNSGGKAILSNGHDAEFHGKSDGIPAETALTGTGTGTGTVESKGSVSDETGGEPPDSLADLRALPIEKGAWRLAVKVLVERGGVAEKSARSAIGKWVSAGLSMLDLWAISEDAWLNGTLDPLPYLIAATERINAERGSGEIRTPSEKQQRFWAQEWRDHPRQWRDYERGPPPGQPGCRIRPEILAEIGVAA